MLSYSVSISIPENDVTLFFCQVKPGPVIKNLFCHITSFYFREGTDYYVKRENWQKQSLDLTSSRRVRPKSRLQDPNLRHRACSFKGERAPKLSNLFSRVLTLGGIRLQKTDMGCQDNAQAHCSMSVGFAGRSVLVTGSLHKEGCSPKRTGLFGVSENKPKSSVRLSLNWLSGKQHSIRNKCGAYR